jgi:hypothetical protein
MAAPMNEWMKWSPPVLAQSGFSRATAGEVRKK